MPRILFDPPNEIRRQQGSGLSPEKRAKYVSLCQQLIDSQPDEDMRLVSQYMILLMEMAALEFIDTLPKCNDRDTLERDLLHICTKGLHHDDPNPFRHTNIVALQLSILFTIYEHDHSELNRNSYEYKELYESPSIHTTVQSIDWKDYNTLVSFIRGVKQFNLLVNERTDSVHVIPMIDGFVRISEIVDALFKNVHFVGLSFKTDVVDSVSMTPIEYLRHDLVHCLYFEDSCINRHPIITQTFNEFYQFVKQSDSSASIKYSIYFILFLVLHEEPNCSIIDMDEEQKQQENPIKDYVYTEPVNTSDNLLQDTATVDRVTRYLFKHYYDYGLEKLTMFGRAIPLAFRKMVNSNTLSYESVNAYVTLCAERYVDMWKQFREQSPIHGGKRPPITRRMRKRTHRKSFKKQHKTRTHRK